MSPTQLRTALRLLHWSQRGFADVLGCDDRLVRRWASGEGSIPPDIADWLTDLVAAHNGVPPPNSWRRRRADGNRTDIQSTEEGSSDMSQEPIAPASGEATTRSHTFELVEMSWDWQRSGTLVAKGKLAVARDPDATPAIITFEIPVNDPPARNIVENPQDWAVALLRRTMRA